jgi:predicted ribosome-associated RNA-binding protein Tma20
MGMGLTKKSSKKIKEENKDVAIQLIFFLNDAIWTLTK